MATRHDQVRKYSQGERSCKLDSPLGDDVTVSRMSGLEGISQLFRFQIEVATHKSDVAYKDLVGKAVTLSIETESGPTRHFHGITSRVAILSAADAKDPGLTTYQLEVVPALWKLTRRSDCRVFESKSVIDILKEVFDFKGLYALDYEIQAGSYPTIEYSVQYRETDFNFVCRMMEEWGLAYSFRHEHGKHTLVVFDDSRACPACPDAEEAICSMASGPEHGNEILGFSCWQQMPSGKYTVSDYDFKNPSFEQTVSSGVHSLADLTQSGYEIYDFSAKNACGAAEKVEQLRMEAEEAAAARASGTSGSPAFCPGTHVRVKGHFREDLDGQYLITRVEHSLELDDDEATYENAIECLHADIPFRPQQVTPKPVIQGSQTALVVGPKGEEIHCDEYGRIRIQFPWDRYGPGDGDKSCWARVVQGSAGKNWGALFTPRIGQEVVVSFLEGDPDRPLVTGVVYNAEQMPPYDLPANKTQSGIKTRSSKGGAAENFNEIMMEDKKGSELFFVQAEKDMELNVKNDRSKTIGHDQTEEIGNDESITIGGNRKVKVAKDHDEQIEANEKLSVGKDRTRTVSGEEMIQIGKNQSLIVDGARSIVVKKTQTIEVQKDQEEKIGGRSETSVTKEYLLQAKKIQLTADDEISIKTGSAEVVMKKNGDITINGKKISIKGSGDVIIKGSKIAEN